jgi:multiple sugar transport system substrate-binding protein
MAQNNSEEEFNELVTAFFQGRMTRRRFIRRAAQLGLSAALVSSIAAASFAADNDLLESSPAAPNESPVTRERADYLNSKPYKDITINVMVLRSAVGDCVE